MYEDYTYENILKTILDRITEADSTIDVREGSAMWYAVAPVAIELAIAYTNYDVLRNESFVGTATREGIYRACNDIGLDTSLFDATAGIFHAHFNVEVSIGSRWSCGAYTFVISKKDGTVNIDGVEYFRYQLRCETLGSLTKYTVGNLRPITDYGSTQLKVAVLDSCIVAGRDEVADEDVRAYYFEYIANKSEDANIAQYHQWLNEIGSVGAHKVIPTWNGANTVKVVILDTLKRAPTAELIQSVQTYLDPNSDGLGEGKAPIGAKVTVEGGTNAYIDVAADIHFSSDMPDVSDILDKLAEYFREIAFKKSTVNVYEVASIILSSPVVLDVDNVRLGRLTEDEEIEYSTGNITLGEYETPVLYDFKYI